MARKKKYYREIDDVLRDNLMRPRSLHLKTDRRIEAVKEVLCRIPPDIYEQLKLQSFEWDIPGKEIRGRIIQSDYYAYTEHFIIYLSPMLERYKSSTRIILTVVHELGHLIYGREEEVAIDAIEKWGFEYPLDRYLNDKLRVL